MDDRTIEHLESLNRRLYTEQADAFSASRGRPWNGWVKLLSWIEATPTSDDAPLPVLDAGCGNGRFGRFLAAELERPFAYVGVDESASLLAHARAALEDEAGPGSPAQRGWPKVALARLDLMRGDLENLFAQGGLPIAYALVALMGVLHHVPGRARRSHLVSTLAARVREGGLMALSLWRVEDTRWFARRRVPFDAHARTLAPGLELQGLEPHDHLLRFGQEGLRFCHHFDFDEEEELIASARLELVARWDDDEQNRYVLLRRPPSPQPIQGISGSGVGSTNGSTRRR